MNAYEKEDGFNWRLCGFSMNAQEWFDETYGAPTLVQACAWKAISEGRHVLVSAPTGTGKTLSAFLVFVDRLVRLAQEERLEKKVYLIYISPLKSLAGDIRENLRKPLEGLIKKAGLDDFAVSAAIRTGDTSSTERAKMIKSPPHILITTPESFYLLLTSVSGRNMLKAAKALIIDELHAVIGSKRGAHLMLSAARLDNLCCAPPQRIGLSATIEPLSEAAEYLSPDGAVITAPKMKKKIAIDVLDTFVDNGEPQRNIWPNIAKKAHDSCKGARCAIAFAEARTQTEKLAYYVNEIEEGFARTHHGSMSKEKRLQAEQDLRDGKIRLLCATSSMELGIDVGEIDVILQVGNPRTISSVRQRLGRAGHSPGAVSLMRMLPRTVHEGLYCALSAWAAACGGVEPSKPPRRCLDVLAQHLVSMAAGESYTLDNALAVIKRAYPFRALTRQDVHEVLCMLAGDYEHFSDAPARPRLLYDRINGKVEGDAYSRMLALNAGGTIPDRGLFAVKTESGVKLGELDEEFVFEARVGDRFLLGVFAWKITGISKDAVTVTQTSTQGAQPPFWKGDGASRAIDISGAFGASLRRLQEALKKGGVVEELQRMGVEPALGEKVKGYLEEQIACTGCLPSDTCVIMEHFKDAAGESQLMVHSLFGRAVNAPLALLAREVAKRNSGMDIGVYDEDDGFLLFGFGSADIPHGLLRLISPEEAAGILEALLPSTALFSMAFRYNAARALMMGTRKSGRQPLWIQRLRGARLLEQTARFQSHPLIMETLRECLEDYWNLDGLKQVLEGMGSGRITVLELNLSHPSPMSLPLRRAAEAELMYEAVVPSNAVLASEKALDGILAPARQQLADAAKRVKLPESEAQLHSLLMIEGDLISGEIEVPIAWLESLESAGRVLRIFPGIWIAAEHAGEYASGDDESWGHIIRRCLRYKGSFDAVGLADRYGICAEEAQRHLNALLESESIIFDGGMHYHADVYDRARRETLALRRKEASTHPPSCFAALMAGRKEFAGSSEEQLEAALNALRDCAYPAALWESAILPARVNGYRPAQLDALLAKGDFVYCMENGKNVSFHRTLDIDWDAELPSLSEDFTQDERLIASTLKKRGASFWQAIAGKLEGRSPYEPLFSLLEKGIVRTDSFLPVRQWLDQGRQDKAAQKSQTLAAVKRRASSRSQSMSSGRWELSRPLIESSDKRLDAVFDKCVIACRETICGISWASALERLRSMEISGKVRRGYFVEGLSGAQFVRAEEFEKLNLALDRPGDAIVWLCAADPCQIWGKLIKLEPERSFMNLPGTCVALQAGAPSALFENKGQTLRVLDYSRLSETLRLFAQEYKARRLYAQITRIIVKQYPEDAKNALESAGFSRSAQDYVIYQGYI
ncbi:MAG: DEAD/DEAH box helicase [Clostridiales bacterium]|nr:DEAD/DEAH box helicase [Clostridiales bacterium]